MVAKDPLARLRAFQESDTILKLRELDGRGDTEPESIFLAVKVESRHVSHAVRAVDQVDRELRRIAALRYPRDQTRVIRPDGTWYKGFPLGGSPRPLPVEQASLEIVEASVGSLDLLLVPVGLLVSLLASDPATAMANALQIMGGFARIKVFKSRVSDPLSQISARQALNVLAEFDRRPEVLAGGEPDADETVGSDESAPHQIPRGFVRMPDGTVISGRTITLVTRYPDGASDVIFVEG